MQIDTSFLHELDRFNLIVKKRVTSNYRGSRRSMAKGRGIVFSDHRIYVPGDDIRAIDWRVYGRTDDLFVKMYEEEMSLVVHILIDLSRSMDFGRPLSKADYASMLGVGFAYLTMKENEKFQFSTFSDTLVTFKSKKGMHQLASTITYLNKLKPDGITSFRDIMEQYKRYVHGKSLIILISDFLSDIEEIRRGLVQFGKHDLKVIQVLDRVEKDLKFSGDMRLKDSESDQILRTFVSPSLRSKYQHNLGAHTEQIEKACLNMGANFHQVTTDTPIFDSFYSVLE